MKVENEFNRDKMEIVVKIQSNLLKKYYRNLVGFIEKKKDKMPRGYTIHQSSSDMANISFPIPDGTMIDSSDGMGKFVVNLTPVMKVIDNFAVSAIRYELEHTEFIPINGYPLENLQTDIVASVKNKRNLCVLKDYSEYLSMEKEHKYQFTQKYINYGTSEWADLVLLIRSGDMKKIKEIYTPLLEFTDWC